MLCVFAGLFVRAWEKNKKDRTSALVGGQALDQVEGKVRIVALAALSAMALLSASCSRPGPQGAAAATSDPSGYLPAPTVTGAARSSDGSLVLVGRGPGDAEIRLQQPDGGAFSATSSEDGAWSMRLPAAAGPRMFAFEGEVGGRVVHAEGAVLTLPSPGPAAVLTRAGSGGLVIGQAAGDLRLEVIDYDGGGGGAVSGVTAPHAMVRFVLDNQPVGASEADAQGRFSALDLSARVPLAPGGHNVRIETQVGGRTAAVEGRWTVSAAAPLGADVFRAFHDDRAWRVDWRIPGGGVQTTVVFDQLTAGGKA